MNYIVGRLIRIAWCAIIIYLMYGGLIDVGSIAVWIETLSQPFQFVLGIIFFLYPIYCMGWGLVCFINLFSGPSDFNTPTPFPIYFFQSLFSNRSVGHASGSGYSNIDAMIKYRNDKLNSTTFENGAGEIVRSTQILDAASSGSLPPDHARYLDDKLGSMTYESSLEWLKGSN